jgi:hypothetical protein
MLLICAYINQVSSKLRERDCPRLDGIVSSYSKALTFYSKVPTSYYKSTALTFYSKVLTSHSKSKAPTFYSKALTSYSKALTPYCKALANILGLAFKYLN